MRLTSLLTLLVLSTAVLAQDETPTKVTPQNRTGDLPYSTSIGSEFEHVDALSGNLIVTIPIVTVPGRGMDFNFQLRYDARFLVSAERGTASAKIEIWNVEKRPNLISGGLGWTPNQPYVTKVKSSASCSPNAWGRTLTFSLWGSYIFHDANGGAHLFPALGGGIATCEQGTYSITNLESPDSTGAGMWASIQNPGQWPGVYLPNGTRLSSGGISPALPTPPDSEFGLGYGTYTDSNGNVKQEFAGGQDTIGRTIITQQNGTNQIIYWVRDSSGNQVAYTINFIDQAISTSFNAYGFYGLITEYSGTRKLISSIVLPNNTMYTFQYDSFGHITHLSLPTGATVDYEWSILHDMDRTYRYVSRRTLHVGSDTSVWTISHQISSSCPDGSSCKIVTVTDPLLESTEYTASWAEEHLQRVVLRDANGSQMRRFDLTNMITMDGYLPLVTSMNTTLENGLASFQSYAFDSFTYPYEMCGDELSCEESGQASTTVGETSRGNLTDAKVYDWNSVLLRHAHHEYRQDAGFAQAHIVNLVGSSTMCGAETCSDTNKAAQTIYDYDTRGNATHVKKWLNTNGALLDTVYAYDGFGNITSITDPGQHPTSFVYDDNYADAACAVANARAYVTRIYNALNQMVERKYYSCTGLLQSRRDQNDVNVARAGTTHTYDLLGRLTQGNTPDGGQVANSYNDVYPASVTTTTKMNSSVNMVSAVIKDGLGRGSRTELADPEGDVFVDTTYDLLGRVKTVSNPYRSTSDPTYGTTETQYDALGRVYKIFHHGATPSGSDDFVQSYYAGNCTTAADETGRQRKSCSDGLGRLTGVWEDPAGLNYETDYQYDALGNLLHVDQKGDSPSNSANWRTRTFAYNSLSQLLTANNPESGPIAYTYDGDGNLVTRADARVTTNYSPADSPIDALHRVTKKSYSDGTWVAFAYDEPSILGKSPQNPIGRLTHMQTSDGATATIFSYDPMGRAINEWPCTLSNCNTGGVPITAGYDKAGHMTTLSYPSGRVVANGYSSAGRLATVDFASFNGTTVNYRYWTAVQTQNCSWQTCGYWPHGAVHLATPNNGVTDAFDFNSRLQQTSAIVGAPSGWNVNPSNRWAGRTMNLQDAAGHNNGNVTQVVDMLKSDRTQVFTYDALNRLQSAQESDQNGWGQSFTYDAWGNLLRQTTTKGLPVPPNPEPLCVTDAPNNRFGLTCGQATVYQYDAAGNMTYDGANSHQFDAESRIKTVNNGSGATYTYEAAGNRVRKDVGSDATEYVYFGGQVIAEHKLNGDWSDYIYANGKRIARADNYNDSIHIHGTMCSNCGWHGVGYSLANAGGLYGYTIRDGDYLYLAQFQPNSGRGGPMITFDNGVNTNWNTYDTDGYTMNDYGYFGFFHRRAINLSPYVGRTITDLALICEGTTPDGASWDIYFMDIALVSADGTVKTIYHAGAMPQFSSWATISQLQYGRDFFLSDDQWQGAGPWPHASTTYYHGDHLGSSRLLTSYWGFPVEQSTFLPFGQEWNAQTTTNHYKFTGKERDSETGLDYFGARYYGSTMGRWLSPDWSSKPSGVPYADFSNPQSLNLYSYVQDNPATLDDADGHCLWDLCIGEGVATYTAAAALTALTVVAVHNFTNYVTSEQGRADFHALGSAISGLYRSSDNSKTAPATPAPATAPTSGQQVPTQAPGFVADAGGNVVRIPSGSTARPADNGNGVVYQPPVPAGAHPDASAVRVMDPTAAQPTGSIVVHGPTGQPINPATGKPDTRANTHTPVVPVAPKPCPSGGTGCSQ